MRNPKDVVVSFFYFMKMFDARKKDQTFGEFFEDMRTGQGNKCSL